MMSPRTVRLVWAAAILAALPAGCDRPGGGKPAAPLISLPPVFAAGEGREWVRLASPESSADQGGTTPLAEQFRSRKLVAEPLGGAWYLLVRNDAEGRCDLGGPARFTKVEAQSPPDGQAIIQITVPAASRKALEEFSGRNLERVVAFTVDGVVYAAPALMSKLSSALQIVRPAPELERARALADRLARGASTLSLRAVVLVGEAHDEADLRARFRRPPAK